MNLIELATGSKSSEYTITLIIVAILGCQVLGIDAAILLPLILDGADIVKYEELIKALGNSPVSKSQGSTWALAAIGVGYPIVRAYIKSLKTDIVRRKNAHPNVGGNTLTDN